MLNNSGICRDILRDQETHLGRGGQCANLGRIAIKELQALQAGGVEVVINVFGEVGAYGGFFETEAWSPFAGDLVEVGGFESVVAGLLKYGSQVLRRRSFTQCFLANCPEGEDEGLAGVTDPLLSEVDREIAR